MIKLATGQIISVTCPFEDGIERLQEAITRDQSGGIYGHTWPLACAFVRSGVDWTGWTTYHERLRNSYHKKLGDALEYRSSKWESEKERKAIMWERHDTCRSLYGGHYIPEGVMLPTYLEGPPATPSLIRMTAVNRGLSEEVTDVWFLKSFASKQFHLLESSDHDTLAWCAMKEAGLVVSADIIDPYEGVRLLDFAALRVTLRYFNLPRARSGAEAKRIISNNILPDDLRSFLYEKTSFKSYWKILPPDGIDWDDFQSWRRLCCTNRLRAGVPLSPDRLILWLR